MTFATLNVIHELLLKAKEEKYNAYKAFREECNAFADQHGLSRVPKDLQFKIDRLYEEYQPYLLALDDFETQDFR